MNRNRNQLINFFVTKVQKGTGKIISQHHDHWINKPEDKHNDRPNQKNNLAHKHRASKKKYHYKKKGVGGYA